jgi:hypothetical protein
MAMGDRCVDGRKHSWRKVASVYSKEKGLVVTKKHCIKCRETKDVNE